MKKNCAVPVFERIDIEPSELPQANTKPSSWGAKHTEFTENINNQNYSMQGSKPDLEPMLLYNFLTLINLILSHLIKYRAQLFKTNSRKLTFSLKFQMLIS